LKIKAQLKNKESFLEQRRKFIDIRRKKLAELLMNEEQEYKMEIISQQETPEQVRLKMESKLKELKGQREKERLDLVKTQQERRFYQSADELRKK